MVNVLCANSALSSVYAEHYIIAAARSLESTIKETVDPQGIVAGRKEHWRQAVFPLPTYLARFVTMYLQSDGKRHTSIVEFA